MTMIDCAEAWSELVRLYFTPWKIIEPAQPSIDPEVQAVPMDWPENSGCSTMKAGVLPGTNPPWAVRSGAVKFHESGNSISPPVIWAEAAVAKASASINVIV